MSTTKKCIFNWVEWFKVQLHKEMIVIQKKARKVRNSLIGCALTLVIKYYVALEYAEEDEKEPIVFLQRPKKKRKRML
jgi:hypothetical protein